MANTNTLIDSFARFHRNLYGEIGSLMGDVLNKAHNEPSVVVTDNIEERIMKAVDERFAALEQKVLTLVNGRLSGQKRKQPDTPDDSDEDEEEVVEAEEVVAAEEAVAAEEVVAAEEAPVEAAIPKGQMLITQFAPMAAEVNEIVNALSTISLMPKAAITPASEEEEEASLPEGSVAEEEEEEEEAELTPFKYKGKDYYMDGDCNVYALDEDGELIEDPVGIYDEKTRRITFNS